MGFIQAIGGLVLFVFKIIAIFDESANNEIEIIKTIFENIK